MSEKKFLTLDTKIDRVVVYLDGARIYRSGKIELKKGYQQMRVTGLTKKLLKDSVRVSGKGKGSLGAIDIEPVYQKEISNEAINKLIEEEKNLVKELAILQENLNFTQHQNEQMKVLSQKFSTEFPQWFASGESSITTLSEFIDFETKSNSSNLKTRKKLEDDIENLNQKISILRAKINEFHRDSKVEQTYDITIAIDAQIAGPFQFELSYQTKGVRWQPSYDVDLKVDEAVIKGMAQITNQTLEDWENVELSISTAVFKPIRVIEPNPFYVDIYQPRPPPSPGLGDYRAKKMAPRAASMSMAKEAVKEMEEDSIMEEPMAEVVESPAGVQSYEIPGKWIIPSDGNEHPVTLTVHELKSSKEYYWSTSDSLGVIAQDKIINGDSIILAGKTKVYSDGEFIGETFIEQIAPKEDFKLGAREELKMKAEKKLLKRVKDKAGITKGKRSISYEYELIIKNFLKTDAQITIKDLIPYSRSERIKVKNFVCDHTPEKDNLGIKTWELKIKADSEMKVPYSYEVEWEKDYQISPPLP